ncbi:hypothetical protein DCAR_0103493 [Daucus carota subsp. sativus]|uniref:PORR domain-containing protein n=1 Tax=Daucus carota subsp. sativus TaxID=79200 RepID=A0A166I103_DAUCS|nr:PREDICTED: protein ROOT PRIMORDIUM DEFECTIVE 1 [Daucus carota subsp. sativus]XP_017230703.1 PREDICTED: protein ROOT PRIMORDIUM DEFECTIVE 1 [Daucus carota subsp. sativus]XP_017230704.1 PREDICTED: protein ROOT PRIMORDIUM DEFECTIVE 1 [Daucus carota subsp. sativus]XP_017230705.1 PREDICTED: protein ROOT PRIMORDIUM DEFECTIVE 1 [Daucus carota subsp. sativus]XP_017230706.1 PREDICTED: protein ROOT PRIMORDIUM DEFECTIVE 1 [Daucus carota subsp. sativus]WOG84310.1 hypothetical protein DCAR_0103493 [Dauc
MVHSWWWGKDGGYRFLINGCKIGYRYQQRCSLVNIKFKWVKDSVLDAVVAGGRELKAACILVSIICSDHRCCLPVYHLSSRRGQLGLPHDLKISTFTRRYPTMFEEFYENDSGGTRVPWFRVTPEALNLHKEELLVFQQYQNDLLNRLRKLLMLTKNRTLPLQTIDQLKWDLGLPYNYLNSLIRHHPEHFSLVSLPDGRAGLRLLSWDDNLAISHLEKSSDFQTQEGVRNENLAFPVAFTRGFGLKRKCMKWLEEWQRLPYTSPYCDSSHLDPRTDVSEKRNVGVFHELLHLTLQKKTERRNVSNLRKALFLPQKFTKVFERHPGIFYISKKSDTQTVVLREAYERQKLIQKHPLVDIREKYVSLMKEGVLKRSTGMYKKKRDEYLDQMRNVCGDDFVDNRYTSEGESDHNPLSEYDSDEAPQNS